MYHFSNTRFTWNTTTVSRETSNKTKEEKKKWNKILLSTATKRVN